MPAMLQHNVPLLSALEVLRTDFIDAIQTLNFDEVDKHGLSKYYFGKGVFSMKKPDSRILSYSVLTKALITEAKALNISVKKSQYNRPLGYKVIYL